MFVVARARATPARARTRAEAKARASTRATRATRATPRAKATFGFRRREFVNALTTFGALALFDRSSDEDEDEEEEEEETLVDEDGRAVWYLSLIHI